MPSRIPPAMQFNTSTVTRVCCLQPQEEGAGTLLVLDSATAFHDVDRAGGLDHRLLACSGHPGPPMTLVDAHTRMAAAVDRLSARHVVVMLTTAAAVQFEDAGLECKAALPPAWGVRCVPPACCVARHTCNAWHMVHD